MQTKALEIRDEGTFIAALAVDMNPGPPYPANGSMSEGELKQHLDAHRARTWLLLRCGYACDDRPNVILTRLDGNGTATNDYYSYGANDRTWSVAHRYIIEHWAELRDGDVVDVSFILGETQAPKVTERLASAHL